MATAKDNDGFTPTVSCKSGSESEPLALGPNKITRHAIDTALNKAVCNYTITLMVIVVYSIILAY